jgi:hypothetical protein
MRVSKGPSRRGAVVALAAAGALLVGVGGCSIDDNRCSGSSGRTGIDAKVGRYGHLQLTLPNGKVWIIGGIARSDCGDDVTVVSSAELYDPVSMDFEDRTSDGRLRRAFFAGAVSNAGTPGDPTDDYALLGGGIQSLPDESRPFEDVRRSVVRVALDGPGGDPGTFTSVGDLPGTRFDLVAVALPDGRVAFLGGRNSNNAGQDAVQVWEPDGLGVDLEPGDFTGSFRERYNHRAVFVPNARSGWILVTGGRSSRDVQDQATAIDLEDNTGYALGAFVGRQYHTLTFLDNGTPGDFGDDAVVEFGGLSDREEDIDRFHEDHLERADAYRLMDNGQGQAPAVTLIATNVPIGDPVFFHAAVADATGTRVTVAGGFGSLFFNGRGWFTGDFIDSDPVRDAWRVIYDGAMGTIAVQRIALQEERAMNAATLLQDGTVLVTGGINGDLNSVRGAELLTP